MLLTHLCTSYLVVESKLIVEVKDQNYFGIVMRRLTDSKTIKEFYQKMAEDKHKIPFTVYEIADSYDFNVD